MIHSQNVRAAVATVLLGLAASSGVAQAASVAATASVTNLTGSLLAFSNDQYLSDASTPDQSGFDASPVLQSYSFGSTQSNGDTSLAAIDNGFAPMPQTSAGAINNGQGAATVLWSFDWTATATGTASVDVEYLHNATLSGYQAGETALVSSLVGILLEGTSLKSEALHFFNNANGDSGGYGDLLLQFGVTEGQTGTFTITTASNAFAAPAPVPVPAALPLLISGLAGLGGFVRRRRKLAT